MSYSLPFPSGVAPHSYEPPTLELQFQLHYEVSAKENTTQLQQRESINPVDSWLWKAVAYMVKHIST